MRENLVKKRWQDGQPALNAWLQIPDSFVAENLAHLGWDSITVDLQHGLGDYRSTVTMFQATSTTATVPMVRVPWNEPGIIMRMLDGGAFGIICPMINDREACQAFVGACRYPPDGYRSYGPRRAELYAGEDYVAQANRTIITMAMIETAEAVENIDAILTTPGLDAIYIGPMDLAQSYGAAVVGVVESAIETVVRAAAAHGIVPGIHTASVEQARARLSQGFRFISVQSDIQMLATASRRTLSALKGEQALPTDPKSVY